MISAHLAFVYLSPLLSVSLNTGDLSLSLIEDAIWKVETNRCESDCPKGDQGHARGPLQIHMICWESVCKEKESYAQCEELSYSLEIFRRTIKRFCNDKRLEMILGRKPNAEDRLEAYAKCWNGGANWWKAKPNSKKYKNLNNYWTKVQSALRQKVKEENERHKKQT